MIVTLLSQPLTVMHAVYQTYNSVEADESVTVNEGKGEEEEGESECRMGLKASRATRRFI